MTSERVAACIGVLVLGWTGSAFAQPADDSGDSGYPALLSQRPIALPHSAQEADIRFRSVSYIGDDSGLGPLDTVYTDVSARAGVGPVELYVGANLLVHSPWKDLNTGERLGVGVVAPIGPGAVNGGVEVERPRADYLAIDPHLAYVLRRRVNERVAIDVLGGLRLHHLHRGGDLDRLHFEAAAGLRAMMTSAFGVQCGARLLTPIADGSTLSSNELELDARGVVATRALDVYAGLAIGSRSDNLDVYVGVAGRLP